MAWRKGDYTLELLSFSLQSSQCSIIPYVHKQRRLINSQNEM